MWLVSIRSARLGAQVTVLDLSQKQIDAWNSPDLPIYEPGLDEVGNCERALPALTEVRRPPAFVRNC